MSKIFYQTCVFGFFHASAPSVLKKYSPLARKIEESPYPDYRLVLSEIIGDYLFRCPNRLFANRLSSIKNPVFLYEFSLPTKTPGFPCCDGISCHTCELPYVFGQTEVIKKSYSWTGADNNRNLNTDLDNFNNGKDSTPTTSNSTLKFQLQPGECISENFYKNLTKEKVKVKEKEKESGEGGGNGGGGGGIFKGLPDLFGAATSWLAKRKNDEIQLDLRLVTDQRVARLMSDFWSTFAKYGDPNGLPTVNGYEEGTRPVDAPWWPRLRGELYSINAMREMQLSAAKRSMIFQSREGASLRGEYEDDESAGDRRDGDREMDRERESMGRTVGRGQGQGQGGMKPGQLGRGSKEGVVQDRERERERERDREKERIRERERQRDRGRETEGERDRDRDRDRGRYRREDSSTSSHDNEGRRGQGSDRGSDRGSGRGSDRDFDFDKRSGLGYRG